jgi:hypothetical protein
MKNYDIYKKSEIIAKINIHKSCFCELEKISDLVSKLTDGEISEIKGLINLKRIDSKNYTLELSCHNQNLLVFDLIKTIVVIEESKS